MNKKAAIEFLNELNHEILVSLTSLADSSVVLYPDNVEISKYITTFSKTEDELVAEFRSLFEKMVLTTKVKKDYYFTEDKGIQTLVLGNRKAEITVDQVSDTFSYLLTYQGRSSSERLNRFNQHSRSMGVYIELSKGHINMTDGIFLGNKVTSPEEVVTQMSKGPLAYLLGEHPWQNRRRY